MTRRNFSLKPNQIAELKEICAELLATIESLAFGLSDVPSKYENEDGEIDEVSYEEYLDAVSNGYMAAASRYAERLAKIDKHYFSDSLVRKLMEEAKKGYLTPQEQESETLAVLRATEIRDSNRVKLEVVR